MKYQLSDIAEEAGFRFHITYDRSLKLKDLSELLHAMNLSVNDYYRDNGICNRDLDIHAPVVSRIGEGSIWLELLISVLSDVTANILAKYIWNRIQKKLNVTKENTPISIEVGDNSTVNIHFHN